MSRDDGTVGRVVHARTRMALPAIARKLIGNVAGYTEVGDYAPRTGHEQAEAFTNEWLARNQAGALDRVRDVSAQT